jgi:hypothetical protein
MLIPNIAARKTKPSMERQRRRRAGIPNSSTLAKAADPLPKKKSLSGRTDLLLVVAVVSAVNVVVAAVVPVMLTEVEVPPVPKEQVAGLVALATPLVTAQVRLTWPVNPPEGITLIVEVLPVVAPGLMVMFPLLLSVKLSKVICAG